MRPWRHKNRSIPPQRAPLTQHHEAEDMLQQYVKQLRTRGYEDAKRRLDAPTIWQQDIVRGDSGVQYLIETEAFNDDEAGGSIRVLTTIYEEPDSAPTESGEQHRVANDASLVDHLSDDFLIRPDGRFVGE
jgi:hypothetical protein